MYQLTDFVFDKRFKFGVADADLQVIGEKHTLKNEHSSLTMWTHFAKTSGKVFQNYSPLEGIDRYHYWKQDVELMKKLGLSHYRTSVSMSRVITKTKQPNKKAIDWYRKYFKYLKTNGIRLYITLYHWELPQFLSEIGGWKNQATIDYLVKHAQIVHQELGEFIDEYFILNEPYQSTFESYHLGCHAPGETNLKGALRAVHNILLAQGLVFRTLKGIDKQVKLSTTYNAKNTYAATNSEKDIKAALYAYGCQTGMFMDPIYLGKYPEYMMEVFANKMPKIGDKDMETIKIGSQLHTFGLNYYYGKTVVYDEKSELKFKEIQYPQGIKNRLGWPVSLPPTYSDGLYDHLCALYNRYINSGMKQIYITESGTCWEGVDDQFRIFFLREHFRQVEKTILAGVPVKGFFVWTLMDNYEWEHGYKPISSFGLVHVDRKTMKRIPKKSYYWYKQLIKNRVLV